MKLKTLVLVGSIATFFTPMTVHAQTASSPLFNNLFVVGDSIADDGNLANYGVSDFPPSSLGYVGGRFSNGPVFAENLHTIYPQLFSSPYDTNKNVAVGGSGSGDFHVIPELSGFAGLNQQVQQIAPFVTSSDLVVMVTGTNDYFFNPSADVPTVVNNIIGNVQTLKNAGAKNVLVFGLPDLSQTPVSADFATNYPQLANGAATQIANVHNDLLQNSLDQLSQDNEINTMFFDFAGWIESAVDIAPQFGITNPTGACLDLDIVLNSGSGSVCDNPDTYGFYDKTHPSAVTHQVLAGSVGEFLIEDAQGNQGDPSAVPEPLTILGAGTAIGFGGLFKRKLAKAGKNNN